MGCCCFNTLRGASFFVASIQIYNGLECMLKFIAFPMLFSSMHASKDPAVAVSFISFMPGMVYSILYFLLGCAIFRGIEQECARTIKWGGTCFAITEICFFILRQVFKVTPTPKVPHLGDDEQPFEMNIYKTLYYFLFTIVGGLIYICILFLYLQQLSKGQDEFAQFFNITARAPWSTPTPSTTTQPAQPPSSQDPHHHPPPSGGVIATSTINNNNSSLQSNLNPGGVGGQGLQGQRPSSKHSHTSSKGHDRDRDRHHPGKGLQGGQQGQGPPVDIEHSQHNHSNPAPHRGKQRGPPPHLQGQGQNQGQSSLQGQGLQPHLNINPVDSGPILSPAPMPMSMDPGVGPGPLMKDPCGPGSPSSPMFPYFLMRRGSKPQPPPHPQHMNHLQGQGQVQGQRCLMDEPPPQLGWGGHPHGRGPPPMPPLRGDFSTLDPSGGTPRSGGSDSLGVGRNLLSPSRLNLNPHLNPHPHSHLGPHPHHPPQFAPMVPPFYTDSGEEGRRESFQGSGFGSPGAAHYSGQAHSGSGYSSRAGGGPESLYQKIPMSPGFDYCLR